MYGTRQLNQKKLKLIKDYKGKYYSKPQGGIFQGLYKVTGVIAEKDTDNMRLVLKEVMVKHSFNSFLGSYNELKPQKEVYFISTNKLKKEYIEVTEKEQVFKIAESLG